MKPIFKLLILTFLYILTYLVYKKYDSYIMLPITTFFLSGMLILDFIRYRLNPKNGKTIKIGKNSSSKWGLYFGIIGGLAFIIFGFFNNEKLEYWGISGTSYFGIFIIVLSLTSYENYKILFNERSIVFNDSGFITVLKYKKISEIQIDKKKIKITTKREIHNYEYPDNNQHTKLIDFLTLRLGDKLIINE